MPASPRALTIPNAWREAFRSEGSGVVYVRLQQSRQTSDPSGEYVVESDTNPAKIAQTRAALQEIVGQNATVESRTVGTDTLFQPRLNPSQTQAYNHLRGEQGKATKDLIHIYPHYGRYAELLRDSQCDSRHGTDIRGARPRLRQRAAGLSNKKFTRRERCLYQNDRSPIR